MYSGKHHASSDDNDLLNNDSHYDPAVRMNRVLKELCAVVVLRVFYR